LLLKSYSFQITFLDDYIFFYQNGTVQIKNTCLSAGITLGIGDHNFTFGQHQINPGSLDGPSVFNLMYRDSSIPVSSGTVLRLAGCHIIERLDNPEPSVPILPVGLTIWIPKEESDPAWKTGQKVTFNLPDISSGILHAIEAGPLLVKDGRVSIDMEREGWTNPFSITSQASRLDYTHMRGPKIGAGVTGSGNLIVVAINGRIRESVGATHHDLAEILVQQGVISGMGFDPGGSVTLLAYGKQLNISPYNKEFERWPVSMPPEPRFVGSAIVAH